MLRILRFGLPILWVLALLAGVPGPISMVLVVGAGAAWLIPRLRTSGTAPMTSRRSHASPLSSSFDTAPSPDAGWTRFTIHPARGKGPLTTLPGFIGAAGASVGAVWLVGRHFPYNASDTQEALLLLVAIAAFVAANWALHRPYLSGYRATTKAPNAFDVGAAGLRIAGTVLPRASLLTYTMRNPYSRATHQAPVASVIVCGTGAVGAAALVGSAVGSGVAQAAAIQRAHLLDRLATHGWILEVIDTRGNAHRLSGGMTEATLDALVHAIQHHLGA